MSVEFRSRTRRAVVGLLLVNRTSFHPKYNKRQDLTNSQRMRQGLRAPILVQNFAPLKTPLKAPLNILVIVLLRKFSKELSKEH